LIDFVISNHPNLILRITNYVQPFGHENSAAGRSPLRITNYLMTA
jgi:hypothetical protein